MTGVPLAIASTRAKSERLIPLQWSEERMCSRQEQRLLGAGDIVEMEDLHAIDQWFDLAPEVLSRLRCCLDLAGQHESHSRASRHLDGDVLPLVRADARETQQKWDLLRGRHQQVLDIDGVVNGANPREVRQGSALRLADRHKACVIDGRGVEGGIGLGDVSMHGVHDGSNIRGTCGHKCREATVVVNYVNPLKSSERCGHARRVGQLAQPFVRSTKIRMPRTWSQHNRVGFRALSGKQRDPISRLAQGVVEQSDDQFDPAIALRWNRIPGWRHNDDMALCHRSPLLPPYADIDVSRYSLTTVTRIGAPVSTFTSSPLIRS